MLSRLRLARGGGRAQPGPPRWRDRGYRCIGGVLYKVSANKLSKTDGRPAGEGGSRPLLRAGEAPGRRAGRLWPPSPWAVPVGGPTQCSLTSRCPQCLCPQGGPLRRAVALAWLSGPWSLGSRAWMKETGQQTEPGGPTPGAAAPERRWPRPPLSGGGLAATHPPTAGGGRPGDEMLWTRLLHELSRKIPWF